MSMLGAKLYYFLDKMDGDIICRYISPMQYQCVGGYRGMLS